MTNTDSHTKKRAVLLGLRSTLGWIFLFAALALSLIYAEQIRDGVVYGIRLSALGVIPAVFPYFVLSDLICTIRLGANALSRSFSSLFGLPPSLLTGFVFGGICGFPIGAKLCADCYRDSRVSRDDCERGICLCSNPSLGFCVGAVGIGCFGNTGVGYLLFFAMLSSTVLVGMFYKKKPTKFYISNEISKQKFNFAVSIKNAGLASLSVSSFIIFFSAIISLADCLVENELLIGLLAALLEVGNATARLALLPISEPILIALCGFALGFSGLSVLLQARASLPSEISLCRLYLFKLLEGLLSGIIALVLALLFFA